MKTIIALLLSGLIWAIQFYTFAYYVNTQSFFWETLAMLSSLISMLLMWMALGLLDEND